MIGRRTLLAGGATTLASSALGTGTEGSAANQWFALIGDEGQPVPNTRAPAELVDEIDDLKGTIWAGPKSSAVQLVEFYDYNCPWCRAADAARDALRCRRPDLRIGLVHNPILSPASAQAARVDLAVLQKYGASASYALHKLLFALPGRINGPRALEMVTTLGHDRGEIEKLAESAETADLLNEGMRLAASLGISITPSYVVGAAVVLGYPGPKSMIMIVKNTAKCGQIVC